MKMFALLVLAVLVLPACGGSSGPTAPGAPAPTPTPTPTPAALFTRSGTGDTVFDMPTTVQRIRIQGSYTERGSNFIVRIAGRLIVNEILGTAWPSTTHDGTYLTAGGVVEIVSSSGVAWTFTEVR